MEGWKPYPKGSSLERFPTLKNKIKWWNHHIQFNDKSAYSRCPQPRCWINLNKKYKFWLEMYSSLNYLCMCLPLFLHASLQYLFSRYLFGLVSAMASQSSIIIFFLFLESCLLNCRTLWFHFPCIMRLLSSLVMGKRWFRRLYVHYLSTYTMVLCHYLFYLLQVEDICQILVIRYICGTWQQYPFDYAVSDDMVFQYITTPPVSTYFSDLVCRLKEQCFHLDTLLHSKEYVSQI